MLLNSFRANPYSSLVAIEGDSDGTMGQLDDGEGVEQMRLSNKSRNQIIGVGMVKFHPGAVCSRLLPARRLGFERRGLTSRFAPAFRPRLSSLRMAGLRRRLTRSSWDDSRWCVLARSRNSSPHPQRTRS